VLKEKIFRVIDVLLEAKALGALLSWPQFSITSFKMVSALARQGVVPATVIDVGANVGQFAVAATKIYSDALVYSIEPHPHCFQRLRHNVRNLANVATFQVALGDAEGVARLHLNSHSHSSSLLPLMPAHRAAFPGAVEVGMVAVKLTTLDSLFATIELKPPVLLKLDVQGYEAQALQGGGETLRRVQWVVAEASLKPMYEGETLLMDLVESMRSCGFSFFRPIGFLADPRTGEILQIDALFGHNRSVTGGS